MVYSKNGSTSGDWALTPKYEAHSVIFDQLSTYCTRFESGDIDRVTLRGTSVYLGTAVRSKTSKKDGSSGYAAGSPYLNTSIGLPLGFNYIGGRLQYNLSAEVIDTLDAKISQLDVTVQAVTNRATASGRKQAADLNYLIRGIGHHLDVSNWVRKGKKSAMINNMGFVKVTPCEKFGVRLEKVHPDEVIIDPADGYYNNPYKMIYRKLVPIEVLVHEFPKYETEILASTFVDYRVANNEMYTPSVLVAEGWVKNTYKKGGRHVICIDNCTLLDDKWDKDYFPIKKFDYIEPEIGYIGPSVIDVLAPIQQELDRFLAVLQKILKIAVVPRVFIDSTAQVNPEHFTNEVGTMIFYNGNGGNAPIIHNGSAVAPEMFRYMDAIIARGYARAGLTAMDTQGQKPIGVDSGQALRTLDDIKSQRWDCLKKSVERDTLELYQIILGELKGRNVKFSALDSKIGLIEVGTEVIPKTFNSFTLQHFPVSAFPQEIAGRIETARDLLQLGVLDPKRLVEVFDMPDISAITTMKSAPAQYVETIVEKMLNEESYIAPEEFDDLDYAEVCATQHYNFAKLNNGTEKAKKLLRRFISEVRVLKKRRDQEAMLQSQEVQQAAMQQAQDQLAQQQKIEAEATKQATEQIKEEMKIENQAKAEATQQLANAFAEKAMAA